MSSKSPFESIIHQHAEAFDDLDSADLSPLLERTKNARVVLIGEASHGTHEFYCMRQRITQALIETHGFNLVTAEADWPDSERVDDYVRLRDGKKERPREIFSRFPTWMWRNAEVLDFVEWLRGKNRQIEDPRARVSFHGLDVYSMYSSIHEVLEHLERMNDPEMLRLAYRRYSDLLAFEPEPQDYGMAVVSKRHESCAEDAMAMLKDLLHQRLAAMADKREKLFDAEQNARVVANAEQYYRLMYHGGRHSWNLRDSHMFETLQQLMRVRGDGAKAVVWAHNSHVGDAEATEMGARGEHNIGQLCREHFGEAAYIIGFGTHKGTVAAADNWGEAVQIKEVRPSMKGSYENLCHSSGLKNFILPLRGEQSVGLPQGWDQALEERAIGVIYRPDTERMSHYFKAVLPVQFDEYIWFDESRAVTPFEGEHAPELPARHPFLLGD
ncbi:MAG: erythromycin esterase family protein [Verrucomicrobiota bacterium]